MIFIFWIQIFRVGEMSLEYYFFIPYLSCVLFCNIDLFLIRSSFASAVQLSRFLTLLVPLYLYCRSNYLQLTGVFKYRYVVWWFLSFLSFNLAISGYFSRNKRYIFTL